MSTAIVSKSEPEPATVDTTVTDGVNPTENVAAVAPTLEKLPTTTVSVSTCATNGLSVNPPSSLIVRAVTAESQRDCPPPTRASTAGKAAKMARGESISLARRAAATAKRRREEARLELERQNASNPDADHIAYASIMDSSAATRANVSQNKAKRNKRVKWSTEEVDALRDGVLKHGHGRWAVILRDYAHAFHPARISVDLKDKWRNLSKMHRSSGSNHRGYSFPDVERMHETTQQTAQNLFGHSHRSRVDAARQAAVAAVQLEPVAEALSEQQLPAKSRSLGTDHRSNSSQQSSDSPPPYVRSKNLQNACDTTPSSGSGSPLKNVNDDRGSIVNPMQGFDSRHTKVGDDHSSHLPAKHLNDHATERLQYVSSSEPSRNQQSNLSSICDQNVAHRSFRKSHRLKAVESLHDDPPCNVRVSCRSVSQERSNERLNRTHPEIDEHADGQCNQSREYHLSVLYEGRGRASMRHGRSDEQEITSTGYDRKCGPVMEKVSEPYEGNLYVEHVETEIEGGVEHVDDVDHMEDVGMDQDRGVEHVEDGERVHGDEHIEELEHIEVVENVDHLEDDDHIEHMESEVDGGQVMVVEHLGDVGSVDHLERETDLEHQHVDASNETDADHGYGGGAKAGVCGGVYHDDVQDMHININQCEYEAEDLSHRSMDLDPRESRRLYRRSGAMHVSRVIDKGVVLQADFDNMPSHHIENAESKDFDATENEGYSHYVVTKLGDECNTRGTIVQENDGDHVYTSLPSVVHVQCSEGLPFASAGLEDRHEGSGRHVSDEHMESPAGEFSHQSDDGGNEGGLEGVSRVRGASLIDISDGNFESEHRNMNINDTVAKHGYLQTNRGGVRRSVGDFPETGRVESSCDFYDEQRDMGEAQGQELLDRGDVYVHSGLNNVDGNLTPEEDRSEHYGMHHSPTLEGAHALVRLEHARDGIVNRHGDIEKSEYEANHGKGGQGVDFNGRQMGENFGHEFRGVSERDNLLSYVRSKNDGVSRLRETRYNCESSNVYNSDAMMSSKRAGVDMMSADTEDGEEENCLRHDDVHCNDELVHVREEDYDRCYGDNSDIKSQEDGGSNDVVGDRSHEFGEKHEHDSKYDRGHEGEWIMRASEEDVTKEDECINSMSDSDEKQDGGDDEMDLRRASFYYSGDDNDDVDGLCLDDKAMDEGCKADGIHGRVGKKRSERMRKTDERYERGI